MSGAEPGARPRIMVVDDTPENLQLLKRMLQDCGCEVLAHPDGEMALRAAQRQPPDLILLDITMPGMDGYEVCQRLKASPATAGVPVIFLSALNGTEDKVRAFAEGGEDFITKPFQFEEVKARVDAHLRLHHYRRELEANHRALEASYAALRDLESMRDTLVHMVVHDMRNLVQPVVTALDFLRIMKPDRLAADGPAVVGRAGASIHLLMEMISTVLDANRAESEGLSPLRRTCDLTAVVRGVLEPLMGPHGAGTLVLDLPASPVEASCDPDLVGRVVLNLVSNALKFTPAGPGAVRVLAFRESGAARVEVVDRGPGIPMEHRAAIFEKFNRGASEGRDRRGTGLGLAFCHMAVAAHGGAIGVEDGPDGCGSRFWFSLPDAP